MDYLKVYEHFYEKAHNTAKRMVMAEMKKSKEKHRPFLNVHNNISAFLYKYVQEKYSNRLSQTFQDSYSLFNNRHSYYEGDDSDVINFILSDEILHSFHKNYSSSYTAFIADLAIEASIKEAQRHYRNYHDYYELIYDLDMYENFFFHDFKDMPYTSSYYYKKMKDIKYPHKAKEPLEDIDLSSDKSKNSKEIVKSNGTKEENATKALLDSFTDDERFLILNLTYKIRSKKDLKLTDFMKLMKIAGSFEDIEVFYLPSKKATSYTKVNKGIDYYKVLGQIKRIESTMIKLEPFNIQIVQEQLEFMLVKLNQNIAKGKK